LQETSVVVQRLYVYPIKSCRGFEVSVWKLEARGLEHDRRWMVVDGQGRFRTQREQPRMALIETALTPDGLQISAPGMSRLQVPFERAQPRKVEVTVWGFTGPALDEGSEAAQWFSTFLGQPSRLVAFAPDTVRPVNPKYSSYGLVAFADAYPLLLLSQASLDMLNAQLVEPVGMDRFRPNLVVSGCDPHAEDTWRYIRVGDTVLDVVKPCDRCSIPAVDPRTGERGKEPTRTLARYRVRDGKIYFGQNCVPRTPGALRVGDLMHVVEV
jgi:uncharacterized protein